MTKTSKTTTAVKKSAAKKAAVKKTAVKAPAKKAAVKKTAAKAPAKKAVEKAAVKKVVPRKPVTTVIAEIDAGFGNGVYIRGSGAGLTWDKGMLMENVSPTEWVWRSDALKAPLEFKLLLNDDNWSAGPNGEVASGGTIVVSPRFE
ncbi:MAG: hypothetical protein JJU00_05320 [Opitutales bacterium]|nr:hypothetical protein [Opitutales bacterium]